MRNAIERGPQFDSLKDCKRLELAFIIALCFQYGDNLCTFLANESKLYILFLYFTQLSQCSPDDLSDLLFIINI